VQAVRVFRQNAGMSQTELAARSGVPQPMISLYECGIREPHTTTLEKLADALDVSPWQLHYAEEMLAGQGQVEQAIEEFATAG
jgi:transcriptional regulator with XRE-family HTH domain